MFSNTGSICKFKSNQTNELRYLTAMYFMMEIHAENLVLHKP